MTSNTSRLTPEARLDRANALAAAARHGEAAALLRGLIRDFPRIAELHFNLGNALRAQGDSTGAARCFQQAATLKPGLADAHFNLANSLRDLGRLGEADEAYRAALGADPVHLGALANQASLLLDSKEHGAAGARLIRALLIEPAFLPAPNLLGIALRAGGDTRSAERWLARAVRLAPAQAAAWSNLADIARADGLLMEAGLYHRRALELDPGNAGLLANLGTVLADQQQADAALAFYDRALRAQPGLSQALWNKALILLSRGRLEEGFTLYEHRFEAGATPPGAKTLPRWHGEPLDGRRLLVWREQGVGDEILWSSCLPDLVQEADCTLLCDPRLAGLFARSFPQATVVPDDGSGETPADLEIPIGSLPLLRRRGLSLFPGTAALRADPVRVQSWRERLAGLGPGPKIGLSWRSRRGRAGNVDRTYTRLEEWREFASRSGATLVNLQYDDDPDERARLPVPLAHWPDLDLLNDFESVAALIAALDGVTTVANTVGALAGALGRPTALLVQSSDWSLLGTRRLPWWSSVTCFVRSPEQASWAPHIIDAADWARDLSSKTG